MDKKAILYRMETDEHTCPFGLRAKDLLRRKGYSVEDKVLKTRAEVDSVKSSLDVKTTPQVIIDDNRIGGFDDLKQHFGNTQNSESDTSYFPVLALFVIAALLTVSVHATESVSLSWQSGLMQFIGMSMVLLGLLKLQNIEGFVNSFLGYDLLARRYVPYGFIYPYAEVVGGLLMVSSILPMVSIPLMLFIGGIGGVSVVKAVYIDKRELKCACVGGDSNVPLGFISFLENAVMFGAALFMLFS
jgi:glutaredoxin